MWKAFNKAESPWAPWEAVKEGKRVEQTATQTYHFSPFPKFLNLMKREYMEETEIFQATTPIMWQAVHPGCGRPVPCFALSSYVAMIDVLRVFF